MSEINMGNLYDFNKNAYSKVKPFDPIELNTKINEVEKDLYDDKYWMLLCHERRDYTIFVNNSIKKGNFAKELKETLLNRGYVLDIEKQEDNSFEIWIRDFDTDENFAYYLFEYSNGIVEVND